MGEISDIRSEPGSDIVCLEGNGYRPSHKGDGYRVGGAMYTLNSTFADTIATACCLIIRTPEFMKLIHQGHWILMAEILHVIKGAYVCLKSEEITISNFKADGAIGGGYSVCYCW